jgi:RsmE family RNA methyltransferase
MGEGTIVSISGETVALELELRQEALESSAVDLVLALPRPQMLKRILEHASACGFRSIALIESGRVDRSYFQSPVLHEQNVRRHLQLGLEQGGHTALPRVEVHRRFRDFLRTLDNGAAGESEIRLIAHPAAAQTLPEARGASKTASQATQVAVGPEGGWLPAEVEAFVERGFSPFHIGRRLLRVETAVTAIWAQLELLHEIDRSEQVRQ